MTDRFGRQAGCTDDNFTRGIETCTSYAFDIEKQVNKNWNKFLFDIFKFLLSKHKLTKEEFLNNVFGSWTIQISSRRIILDGKDYILTLQYQDENQIWYDKESALLSDLSFDKIKQMTTLI